MEIEEMLTILKFKKHKTIKSHYTVIYKGYEYTINKCSETGRWYTCDRNDDGGPTLASAKRCLAFNLIRCQKVRV